MSSNKTAPAASPATARGAPPAGGAPPTTGEYFASTKKARGRPPKPVDTERPRKIVRVDSLVPNPNNARTHSPAQVDKLVKLITEYGWTNPILVAGNDILAGHARRLAALKLGLETVPVIDLSHLTKVQRRAYILADNRAALDAGWDSDLLTLELGELRDDGFDLGLTGFDGAELDALFGDDGEGLTDPDDVPAVPADPVTRLGDVWVLGKHRLVCGDCTDAGVVKAAVAEAKPHLMVTDPPYGVEYDASWRLRAMPEKNTVHGAHGKVGNDDRADWSEAWALFPGDVAYVWHGATETHIVAESLIANGMEVRSQIVWVKHQFVISRGHYHPQHEPCFYAVRKSATGHWSGDRKQSTVWQIDKPLNSETGHSTQKPVECMKRPIENNSSPGQAIYDPFAGSGTTIIAAEMTGRICHAIELAPQYVDVAVRRWEAFTGQAATLEATGRTFAEIEAERAAQPVAPRKRRAAASAAA